MDDHPQLPDGDHPLEVFKARCGALLPTALTQRDQLPSGLTCEHCHLIFLADSNTRGSSHPEDK